MGALFQLKLTQLYNTKQCLMIFGYEGTGSGETTIDLATAFASTIIPLLKNTQNVSVNTAGLDVINLDDPADFYSYTDPAYVGNVTGDGLPTYVSWTFRYNRATRAVRNGYKRVVGVSESQQDQGVPTGGALTALNALAAGLQGTLDIGGTGVWTPRILRALYPHPNPLHLPATYTAFPISGVSYEHVGTQNTRKTY